LSKKKYHILYNTGEASWDSLPTPQQLSLILDDTPDLLPKKLGLHKAWTEATLKEMLPYDSSLETLLDTQNTIPSGHCQPTTKPYQKPTSTLKYINTPYTKHKIKLMKLVKMKNENETWAIVILTIEYTPQRISTTHQYPRLGANVVKLLDYFE